MLPKDELRFIRLLYDRAEARDFTRRMTVYFQGRGAPPRSKGGRPRALASRDAVSALPALTQRWTVFGVEPANGHQAALVQLWEEELKRIKEGDSSLPTDWLVASGVAVIPVIGHADRYGRPRRGFPQPELAEDGAAADRPQVPVPDVADDPQDALSRFEAMMRLKQEAATLASVGTEADRARAEQLLVRAGELEAGLANTAVRIAAVPGVAVGSADLPRASGPIDVALALATALQQARSAPPAIGSTARRVQPRRLAGPPRRFRVMDVSNVDLAAYLTRTAEHAAAGRPDRVAREAATLTRRALGRVVLELDDNDAGIRLLQILDWVRKEAAGGRTFRLARCQATRCQALFPVLPGVRFDVCSDACRKQPSLNASAGPDGTA